MLIFSEDALRLEASRVMQRRDYRCENALSPYLFGV